MIFTGYFAKADHYVEHGLKLVSIANSSPAFASPKLAAVKFKSLVPGNWVYRWKNDLKDCTSLDKAKLDYIEAYFTQCLNFFNPDKLSSDLTAISNRKDVILLCYEKPPEQMKSDGLVDLDWLEAGKSFCHRHLVAAFLREGGYECREYAI